MTNNTPNLDTLDADELWAIWQNTKTHPVKTARKWFPDRFQGYVTATRDIGHYACNKAIATKERLKGDIRNATYYDAICDRIYDRIPQQFLW